MVFGKYNSVALLLLGLVLGVVFNEIIERWITEPKFRVCPQAIVKHKHISCGEKSILSGSILPEKKKEAIAAFADSNYNHAISLLESARKKRPRDPESLIYLNNARIAERKASHYTIAVVAHLKTGTEERDQIGREILRGVAQAQHEVNKNGGINKKMLRVVIADDGGEVDQGKEIAKSLGAQNDILAVVGHYSSKVTKGVVAVYQQNKLVLISSSSATVDLKEAGDFFFRTIPNNRVIALVLAQYMLSQVGKNKAAVFYNEDSPYSRDIKEEFSRTGAKVENTFDMSDPQFDATSAVAEAENQGAEMLVLFPDVKNRGKAREVIKKNKRRYCIMEGSSLYGIETLKREVGKEAVNRLVVATPWHREDSPNPDFPNKARDLWQGEVSWRTALAYDATRALIAALEKSQGKRSGVQQALADPKFEASGATGKISFQPNGDRNEQIQKLTTVVASGEDYDFVLINQAPPLDCD